ncbi:MAG: BatA domain-containing protein [Ignavibacteria bacterium]|nr:BatA domain-containing protein [Ignavibacteria bacterium]
MTFLNPILLLGLLAVLIPIIIHLLNFKRATKIEFSSLMFLKEVKEKQVHKIKIKELILLIIRILIITFLVLSFSKPFIKSESYGDATKTKTAVILFDNSFSMEVSQQGKNLVEIGRDVLNNIKKNYNSTDYFFILSPNLEFTQNINDTNIYRVSYTPFNIPQLLDEAENLFNKTPENFSELFIISDFQNRNFLPETYRIKENSPLKSSHLYFIPVLKRQPANIAIQSIENLSGISDLFTESKFRVRVKNFNSNQVSNKKLNIFFNDSLIFEKFLSFNANEIQNIDFNLKPTKTDKFYIYTELQNIDNSYDEIIKDNKFYYATNLQNGIKVFILSESDRYSEYLKLAIQSYNAVQEKEIVSFTLSNKVDKNINNYNVLILNYKNSLSSEEISYIAEYHRNGGGIMIFPSVSTNLDNLNLLLKEISNSTIEKLIDVYDKENIRLKFSELNHYITDGIYKFKDKENSELSLKETPLISKYFKLNKTDAITPIIKINNEESFLSESRDIYAPVLLYSVSADLLMSDFPLKNIFPVLIVKGIYYLSYKNYSNNLISGKTGIIFLKSNFNFINDANKNIIVSNNFNKGFVSLSATGGLEKPGLYNFSDSSEKNAQYITVNIDTSESNMQFADSKMIESVCKSYGIEKYEIIEDPAKLDEVLFKNRNGIDLTNLFLYLAIAMIVIEILFVKIFFKKF